MRWKIAIVTLLFVATAGYADKRVHQAVALDPSGRLSLDTHNGTVTVTTWNQPKVDIDARVEETFNVDSEDVARTEIRISGSGGSVRIETNYDALSSLHGWFGSGMRTLPPVHYTISMPASASLVIEDHNATVRVSGLRSDLKITSHNGSVEVDNLDGAASINTHNGSIRVAFSNLARASRFETHNGTVEVQLPSSARFDLDAHGHHLGFDSDFPVVSHQIGGSTYVGQVNGGGPELHFSTHNGSLRLKRS